jgi:cytosine/adenosine deaminase-related metal-dependent hydrolase
MRRALHVDAIVIGDGTVVRDGALVLDGARVVDVGAATDVLPRHAGVSVERRRGLLAPGLVNAHTHLELSALRGVVPGGQGFVPWLRAMLKARAEVDAEEGRVAMEIGRAVDACVEHGIVAVGEVTNSLAAVEAIGKRLVGTIFHELLGLDRARAMASLETIDAAAARVADAGRLAHAPSPHALYSTHPDLVRALVARARDHRRAITMHLAEHAAERAFLRDGGGPMGDFVAGRVPESFVAPALDPVAYADALGLLDVDAALVHLADAQPSELARLVDRRAIVVLCPRSNLHIETRLPPLHAIRERGLPYAVATDSLASAPSLDPLADARALHDRFPTVPAIELVSATMLVAARAIGWGDRLGLLAPSRAPGVVHVDVPPSDDPAAAWLRALRSPRTLIAPASPE